MASNKDYIRDFINQRGSSSHIADQSSIFSYITEQPHPDGCIGPDFVRSGREPYPHPFLHPHDKDGALEREMEKKRIREEIIMSEIARRHVLEAEVMSELIMERELALRRDSDRFQLAASSSVMGFCPSARPIERLAITPFRSDIAGLEGGREEKKTILLAKPGESASGSKRKASTQPPLEVDASEFPKDNISSTKTTNEWSCDICGISTTCEQGLQDHFRGKKHKSKEAALTSLKKKKKKTGQKYSIGFFPKTPIEPSPVVVKNDLSPVKENEPSLDNSSEKQSLVIEKGENNENSKNNGLWCGLCNVGVTSHKTMEMHKKGKKHVVRLFRISQNGGPGSSGNKDMDMVNQEDVVEEGKSVTSESVVKALDDVEPEEDDVAVDETEAGYGTAMVNVVNHEGVTEDRNDVTLDDDEAQDGEARDVAKVEDDESKNDFDEEIAGLLLQFIQ